MGITRDGVGKPIGDALFGRTRQAVLRLLFSSPDRRFYQRIVIDAAGLGSGTVQRELEELTGAGILSRTVEGRQAYYQANRRCPVFDELQGLVRKTLGVAHVLKGALAVIARKIHLAFVYGSVAAGNERAESDIDVMVVGDDLSLEKVVTALAVAQRELGREVNPSVYGVDEFYRKLSEGHHFISRVVTGPKVFLIGDEGELRRLAKERLAQEAPSKPARDRRPVRRRRS